MEGFNPGKYKESYSDRHYPVALDLHWELSLAIELGDMSRIAIALDDQESNSTTESISNTLIVRNFLEDQSMDLIELQDAISFSGTAKDILAEAGQTLRDIENRYNDVFVAEETSSEYAKLEGDEYFRHLLVSRDKVSAEAVRYIITVDVAEFSSPEDVYAEMSGLTHFIINDLRGKLAMIWENQANEDMIDSLHDSIDFYLDIIDERIGVDL